MGLLFSRECEYALQAILYMASKRPRERTSIKEISSRLETPSHFLSKILQNLTKKNLLVSFKGPSGGFALAKPAHRLKLLEVVKAIDGNDLFEKCAMGFPECSPSNPCALHEHWKQLRAGLEDVLAKKSVDKVSMEMKRLEYRR